MPEDRNRTFENVKEEELERLAHLIAPLAQPGDFITLKGDLGVGKSVFARSFIRTALGNEAHDVPSPTYTLVQPYETVKGYPNILHVDLYRIEKQEEIRELGLDDAGDSIVLLEWPERLGTALPDEVLEIYITPGELENTRDVTLTSSPRWQTKIEKLTLIRT